MLKELLQSSGRDGLVLVLLVIAMPFVMGSSAAGGVVLIFAIAAAACNLLLGYAGLLSFAQGTFFGIGSYVAGIVLKQWPQTGLGVIPVCLVSGAIAAALIGALSIRQKGIYFVMITLAMAQLAFFAALSFSGLTGGENGLLDIPRPSIGLERWLGESWSHYLVIAATFFLVFVFLRRVLQSPFGQALDAIRENEIRAKAVGFDVQRLKLLAFCVSGGLTAVAGCLYALQLRSAPISSIDLLTSETILIMAILGGRRSLLGAVFGALAMTLMAEQLSHLWPRWQMIVGAVLIATVFLAPNGLGGLWAQWRGSRSAAVKEAL